MSECADHKLNDIYDDSMDDDDVDGEMVMKTRTYKEWDHSADPCLRPISWRILVRESKKSGKWKSLWWESRCLGCFPQKHETASSLNETFKRRKGWKKKMRNKNFGMVSRKMSSLNKKWVKISRKVKMRFPKRKLCVVLWRNLRLSSLKEKGDISPAEPGTRLSWLFYQQWLWSLWWRLSDFYIDQPRL